MGIRENEHGMPDMRKLSLAFAALALIATAGAPGFAAERCRGAHGKFIKCAVKAPAKPVRCKDAKGRFAKCGTHGARPA
jgi:hypothetical protein